MANRIKGITVEINGDVTGLDKALKTVNGTIKETQSQLKDVDRLLKLDPGNTELLTQKQGLLKDAVNATKEKLEALKTAQEQAKQQLESGNLGQDKYDALQREIIETEQNLKKLEDQAKNSNVALNKIADVGGKVKEAGDKISNVGQDLTKYVTAPIVGIGTAAMAAFGEVDSAMDSMITQTGAAGEELEAMETAVTNIATTIPTDFQTAANAVGEVATRFDDVGGNLETLSTKFIQFASINNTDVKTAVDNVQASMAAFGVPTAQAGDVLDTLSGIAQKTGVDVNTLTSMMTQNAGVCKEMGMDYEDTASFLANLNKNGVDSSSVMTGLKKAWQTASKEGQSMDDVLKDMNSTIKNAKTDQEAYQAAIELFGAKAGPAIAQAIRDGRLSLEDFNVTMSDFAGNVETTFTSTLDPIDQTTIMWNELKAVGADLAGVMQEMLMPVLEGLRDKLHQLREWWANLDEAQKENIIRIAAIVAAVGPLLTIIGQVVSVIGTIMTLAPALGAVIGAICSPVGLVVAAIAAAIAIGVLLYKNWDTIKEKAQQFAETVKKTWEDFKTATSQKFQQIKESVSQKWGEIKSSVTDKANEIKESVNGKFSTLKEDLTTKSQSIKEAVAEKFGNMKTAVSDKTDAMKTDLGQKFETIKTTLSTKCQSIKEAVLGKFSALKEDADTKFGEIKEAIFGKFDSIKEGISERINAAKEAVRDAIENIKNLMNFEFQLPHIPLPHFSISPPGWSIGDLLKGVIPSLDIAWYRKAMNGGMILNGPTIFGMQNGHLLGGGEAGSETVVGTSSLMKMIQAAVSNASRTYGDVNVIVNTNGNAETIAREIGAAVNRERRMAGSW